MTKAKLVTGLFKSKIAAESAVDAILKRGFTRDDISVLMSDATRSKEFALQTRSHAADGLGIGSAVPPREGRVRAQARGWGDAGDKRTISPPGRSLTLASTLPSRGGMAPPKWRASRIHFSNSPADMPSRPGP